MIICQSDAPLVGGFVRCRCVRGLAVCLPDQKQLDGANSLQANRLADDWQEITGAGRGYGAACVRSCLVGGLDI